MKPLYVRLHRRTLTFCIAFILILAIAVPALADYLGPDRVTITFEEVRDPDNDVWTLTHIDPGDGFADVCLIVHTCEEHPSVERQLALCGWVADNSGCSEAYKIEETEVVLPEATIAGDLQNCTLNNGWCTTSPSLSLIGVEPLAGESITLIEGTRNGEPFACAGGACAVPLVEGGNSFTFWALSSYGDSSQMGNLSAQVDTVPPNSAFNSPLEGSEVWVSGGLELSGASSDATSGVAGAELSLDGGGSWTTLALGAGSSWFYSWDTATVPEGTYQVLVRANDVAGHLESTARITVHVDRTPPSLSIPDSWYIWESLSIGVDDDGVGLETIQLTIHGGEFGLRKYQWSPGNLPNDFIWDRYLESVVAPIGEYKVTVEVADGLNNLASATGKILIPAPDPSEEPEAKPADAEPISSTTEEPAVPSEASSSESDESTGGALIVSTPTETSAPSVAGSLGQPAAPLTFDDSATTESGSSGVGSSGLLWGAAALAAASAATAYAFSRRSQRQEYIEQKRKEAAEQSSSSTFARRLISLRERAEARTKPIRGAMIAAAAAAAATAKAAQNRLQGRKGQKSLAEQEFSVHRATPPKVRIMGSDPSPTPTPPYPTPTPSPVQSPTQPETATPHPTPSATQSPTQAPTPSATPSPISILPTNTRGPEVFDYEDLKNLAGDAAGEFVDSFSLVPGDSPPLKPSGFWESLEALPYIGPVVQAARVVLTGWATFKDIFAPFRGLDPTYPLDQPVPGEPTGQQTDTDEVS